MDRTDSVTLFNSLSKDIGAGKFSPFYLLAGEEPFYPEKLCGLIMEKAVQPHEADFNRTVLYGTDTNADEIVSACERYPVMAERQLVVVKEAQALKKLERISDYLDRPSPTTILVLCFSGKNADKRTSLYKKALKSGTVFESPRLPIEEMPRWIERFFASEGKGIEPEAAMLLAEYAGNDLRKISLEAEKLSRAMDEGTATVTAADIERNIGISREFNITELTGALATKDSVKAFRIAYYFGESPKKYPLQMTLGFLFYFFSKVEMIHAFIAGSGGTLRPRDAAAKAGLYYRYAGPYISAATSFNLRKTMSIIAAIKNCDYKSKTNSGGEASDGDLLNELIGKILL